MINLNNGVQLETLEAEGRFLGFGEVRIGGTQMRSARRPLSFEIRTPDAQRLVNYRIVSQSEEAGTFTLSLSADVVSDGFMEYMLHTVRSRYRTDDWSEGPQPADAQIEIQLRPLERIFGETLYTGFAYRYRYASPIRPIYRILDRGTWEPGGSAVGNEFWLRNGTSPSTWRVDSAEQRASTEWFLPGIEQPNIFQFLPFQVQLCGFTQTFGEFGDLITYAERPAHIRSLFEKSAGKTELVHWHEHCGDLSHDFSTEWVAVLWNPTPTIGQVAKFNRWESIREVVWSDLHLAAGIQPETVRTYGVLEEWGRPNLANYADQGVPKLAEAGCETFMIPSQQQNNMNVYGASNMCCVVDWKLADEPAMSNLGNAARSHGGWIEMWGNTALSALQFNLDINAQHGNLNGESEVLTYLDRAGTVWEALSAAKRPWVRNPAGHIEADHYTPVFCQTNLADPAVRSFWHSAWNDHKDRFGVGGMFLDSSFNMSADKFAWSQNAYPERTGGATIDQTDLLGHGRPPTEPEAAITSQYHPYLDTLAQMQRDGFHLSTEDTGVFFVSRSGPDVLDRIPALPLWVDSLCVFDGPKIRAAGHDEMDIFFLGLAYRNMWYLYWHPTENTLSWRQDRPHDPEYAPTNAQLSLYHAYRNAVPHFGKRLIHPAESMIEYQSDAGRLLWVRKAQEIKLNSRAVTVNLIDGSQNELDIIQAPAQSVYFVSATA